MVRIKVLFLGGMNIVILKWESGSFSMSQKISKCMDFETNQTNLSPRPQYNPSDIFWGKVRNHWFDKHGIPYALMYFWMRYDPCKKEV